MKIYDTRAVSPEPNLSIFFLHLPSYGCLAWYDRSPFICSRVLSLGLASLLYIGRCSTLALDHPSKSSTYILENLTQFLDP